MGVLNDPIRLLSDCRQAMVAAVRSVLDQHHRAAATDLRELITSYPLLRSATLEEVFGMEAGAAPDMPVPPIVANTSGDWVERLRNALGRQHKQPTYNSMHELVDRFYLRAIMMEHKSISAAAEHLKISRQRLRARLQLVGLYGDYS